MTHRGDPAAWCAGSGGKYRELVLEGNQGRLKKCGFRLECTKRAGTVPLTEIVVILGNAVTSQHGALLSDDIKALKTNR